MRGVTERSSGAALAAVVALTITAGCAGTRYELQLTFAAGPHKHESY